MKNKEGYLEPNVGRTVLAAQKAAQEAQMYADDKIMDGAEGTREKPVRALERIADEDAKKAMEILRKYKEGKRLLDERVLENEQWWEFKEWEILNYRRTERRDPEPVSAWMFNSIINKHADFMDNFPAPNILPREESDKEAARILSSVVPCILDQCDYEAVYNAECWDKLKSGTGIYGIFWDPYKNGIGDIEIRNCDVLNLTWEPGVEDIQKSPSLFYQSYVDNSIIEADYPEMKGKLGDGILSEIPDYIGEGRAYTEGKSLVTDWYYKKSVTRIDENGIKIRKTAVHLCKICQGTVLYATENDDKMPDGLYEHGQYPFVFDTLFPIKKSPAGMGYVDVMKSCQMYIDKMGQSMLKNAVAGARPRYMSKDGGGINESEYTDLSRDIVHYVGNPDDIKPIDHYTLDGAYINLHQLKIDELKETSGNRDFSQGSTASGVTAASAIAALQEAGSKLSRDMIKTSYRVHRDLVYQVIELIRQFYTTERAFRITGDKGQENFVTFDNRMLRPDPVTNDFGIQLGGRKPYFDIKIVAQKSSPFTKIAQNELAKEMYNLGFFNPQLADQALMCVGMMDFDGKEEIERKISENGTMLQQMMQMQSQMEQMAMLIAESTGDTRILDALAARGQQVPGTVMPEETQKEAAETDAMGNLSRKNENAVAARARKQAATASAPKA